MTTSLVGIRCLWDNVSECVSKMDFPSDDTVSTVINCVSQEAKVPRNELAVVFSGRVISGSTKLSSCLSPSVDGRRCVYLTRRKTGHPPISQNQDNHKIEMLLTSVQTAMMDTQHRHVLMSLIGNADGFASLVASTPGLRDDLVAQGILRDPFLVLACLAGESGEKIVLDHPCLVPAVEQLMGSLYAEASRLAPEINAAMFEEEQNESSEEEGAGRPAPRRPMMMPGAGRAGAGGGPSPQVTPQQLASALALAATAAQGGLPQGGSGSSPSSTTTPANTRTPSTASNAITQDILQRALMGAVGNTPQTRPQPSYSEEMSQLQSMGFVNATENLEALRASTGDLERALAYIVEKREREEMNLD